MTRVRAGKVAAKGTVEVEEEVRVYRDPRRSSARLRYFSVFANRPPRSLFTSRQVAVFTFIQRDLVPE